MFKLSSFVVLLVALICINGKYDLIKKKRTIVINNKTISASPQWNFPDIPVVPTIDPNSMVEIVPTPSMGNTTVPGNDMIGGVATMPPTPATGNMTNGMTDPLTNGLNHIHNSRNNRNNRNRN